MSLQKLGRYDIVRVLGKGAMGIVYEARDPILERRVAIKTVSLENLSGGAAAEYEARFRVEARSAARLQHPNIVSVYDSGWEGGLAFLVMEYIQGEDLKQHLDLGERYSLEQSIGMVGDLLAALEYAHKQGIVHRDVKPANLLMESSGRLKLTDFGVARIQDSGDVTRTQGTVVGTLKYMSPEQAQGQKADTRADLYSVGVVLYQLLTDKRPFDVENEFSLAQQIVYQPAVPPSALNPRLPSAIDEVVMRALAKKADQRFSTAAEFASALRSAVGHAEDATVLPPADPARTAARLAAGTGPLSTSSGASSTGNSTITQELELVYWKDVKDSADAEDLHVFLAKFPAGVYADLARRQLRKLAGGTGTGQPPLSGTEATLPPPIATPHETEYAAPEVASPSEKPTSQAAPVSDTPGVAPIGEAVANDKSEQPSQEDQTTQILPARSASNPALKIADRGLEPAAQESAEQAETPTISRHGAVPGTPSRRWKLLIAGGAGVAICAVAALLVLEGGGNGMPAPKTAGQAAVTAPVASAPAPVELSAASYSAVATPVEAAAQRASTIEQSASAATKNPVSPSTNKRPIAPKAAIAAPTPASPQLPQATDQARPRAAAESSLARPASASTSAPLIAAEASPVDGCQDRNFLSREYCLNKECEKPGARSHPLCVKHREEQRLREESRVRN